LNLSHKCISDPEVFLLCSGLAHLSDLNVFGCFISDKGAVSLLHKKLISLNIGSNSLGKNGIVLLFNNPFLHSLKIESSRIGEIESEEKEEFICLSSSHITSLNLGNNFIGNEGTFLLSKCFNLKALNVRNNRITIKGMKELVCLPNLESLCISNNKINSLFLFPSFSLHILDIRFSPLLSYEEIQIFIKQQSFLRTKHNDKILKTIETIEHLPVVLLKHLISPYLVCPMLTVVF